MDVRILLLQARHRDDPAKDEERFSFAARLGMSEAQVVPHDLLSGPPTLQEIQGSDVLIIGGAGDFYVSKGDLPNFQALLQLLVGVVDLGHPTFASCFGFHCLVEALGGKIVHDPSHSEVGTYQLTLTSHGKVDPLLKKMPSEFLAQMGHKDRAEKLPKNIVNLASSELCQFQAFRIPDKPIWAFQFHPELNPEENRRRFIRYLDGYASYMSEQERVETLKRFRKSPETEQLLPHFVKLIFG